MNIINAIASKLGNCYVHYCLSLHWCVTKDGRINKKLISWNWLTTLARKGWVSDRSVSTKQKCPAERDCNLRRKKEVPNESHPGKDARRVSKAWHEYMLAVVSAARALTPAIRSVPDLCVFGLEKKIQHQLSIWRRQKSRRGRVLQKLPFTTVHTTREEWNYGSDLHRSLMVIEEAFRTSNARLITPSEDPPRRLHRRHLCILTPVAHKNSIVIRSDLLHQFAWKV